MLKLKTMHGEMPSLPPSMMTKASPGGRLPLSGEKRMAIAAANSLACLPSLKGGSLTVGCVAASPTVFVSLIYLRP